MPLNQYSFFHLYVQFSNRVRGRKQIPMTVSEYIIRTCFFSKNPAEVSKGVVSTETLPGAGAACGSSDDIPVIARVPNPSRIVYLLPLVLTTSCLSESQTYSIRLPSMAMNLNKMPAQTNDLLVLRLLPLKQILLGHSYRSKILFDRRPHPKVDVFGDCLIIIGHSI